MKTKYSIKDLEKIVDGNPSDLLKWSKENGVNFDGSGIGKKMLFGMIANFFPITPSQKDAVDFLFWISYYLEKEVEELVKTPELHIGARVEFLESVFSRMHFGDKIQLMQDLYADKKDPLIKFMRKIQNFRNDIAHGRFNKLTYGGYSLGNDNAHILMIGELRDALLDKTT